MEADNDVWCDQKRNHFILTEFLEQNNKGNS